MTETDLPLPDPEFPRPVRDVPEDRVFGLAPGGALSFDAYFEWLVPWEGSVYENDPDDPGGATKYGIDQRSHPGVDIRNLTKAQAKAIYLREYWNRSRAPQLPPRTAWAVTDCAVNCGLGRAAKWLQAGCGASVDGAIGPKTLSRAASVSDNALAKAILDTRAEYYVTLANQSRFRKYLKGWLNRNNDLRKRLK